jgi:hypothetical protein
MANSTQRHAMAPEPWAAKAYRYTCRACSTGSSGLAAEGHRPGPPRDPRIPLPHRRGCSAWLAPCALTPDPGGMSGTRLDGRAGRLPATAPSQRPLSGRPGAHGAERRPAIRVVPRVRRRIACAGWAGIAGICCYSWFLFAPLGGGRLDTTRAFVSELAVPGSPASGWYRGADVAAGVLIIVLARGVREWLGRPARGAMAGAVLVATVGAAAIVDGVSPMTCAPSADPVCRRIEQSQPLLGQLTDLHTVSGVLGMTAAAAAMILVGRRARPVLRRRWVMWVGVAGCVAVLLLGSVLSALALFDGPGVGIVERVQLLVVASWLGAVSAMLILRRPPRPEVLPGSQAPRSPRSGRDGS